MGEVSGIAQSGYLFPSRVMKKGKKSENHSNSEARRPTVLTTNGVFQHPARDKVECTELSGIRFHPNQLQSFPLKPISC